MEEALDTFGNVLYACPKCVRVSKGRCWECGAFRSPGKSVYCESCRKELGKLARANYALTDKGKKARKKYLQSEAGQESMRRRSRDTYNRNKLKILLSIGYSSYKDPARPPQKSGWKVIRE